MKRPEYITADEVKRVCNEIGLRDWSEITDPSVSEEEAFTILNIVNTKGMNIPIEAFAHRKAFCERQVIRTVGATWGYSPAEGGMGT